MKKQILFLLSNILLLVSWGQSGWQQQVDYTIDVTLNDKEKTLDAFEKLVYTNHSPDTLHFLWFHLWPNAYKNDRTAFSDQLLENGSTVFYFSGKEQKGYINRLDFKVQGVTAKTEDHPQYIDIIKLVLPAPLPPHASVTITTPFHVKLPFNRSRGGYDGQTFQITQWYPKPAVYDKQGWHEMPYLDQGEFYSDFGSYDVRITLPADYVVAATGELQNAEEKAWLRSRTGLIPATPQQPRIRIDRRNQVMSKRKPPPIVPVEPVAQGLKTLRYQQDRVHDFAWFADKSFLVQTDTLQLADGHLVGLSAFFQPGKKELWQPSLSFAKEALRFYSAELGTYPYTTATVVQGPPSFGGGMEYPTITVISGVETPPALDATIAHELGHNWFYGILATNERQHPWMDEGMNTFYENRYKQRKYGKPEQWEELAFQHLATNKRDQPIATPSDSLQVLNYELVTYHKTSEWMKALQQSLGEERFRQMMQEYFRQWQFRHPQPEDFKETAATYLGDKTEALFGQLYTRGILPSKALHGTTVVFPLKKGSVKKYLRSPTKNFLLLSPALGANTYDKLLLGGLLTNYGSPTSRFNFLLASLYATGSSSFTGIGKLNYAITSDGFLRKTDLFLNASSFHMDEFADSSQTYRLRFVKLVPGVRFSFREKNPRSTVQTYLQWKTFFLNEQSFKFSTDSIFGPTDTVIRYRVNTPKINRYLNQLQLVYQDNRALYPFDATLQVEQARDFVRTSFTGNYFFNYAKSGGLSVRVFAGKFSYLNGKTTQKQFANDRYRLNLSGPNGYEDYTYSDYFIGRNQFEGLSSQQLMIRDGALKVRTDLLASKVGKTDNWLAAANLVSTVPENLNPFSVLPFHLPLRVFADIGTYAEAWDRTNNADRFLFDAGIQLSLLHETVNVYVPLLYSRVYRDYFKSTIPTSRFWKTISFSIHFYNKDLKKLNRYLEF